MDKYMLKNDNDYSSDDEDEPMEEEYNEKKHIKKDQDMKPDVKVNISLENNYLLQFKTIMENFFHKIQSDKNEKQISLREIFIFTNQMQNLSTQLENNRYMTGFSLELLVLIKSLYEVEMYDLSKIVGRCGKFLFYHDLLILYSNVYIWLHGNLQIPIIQTDKKNKRGFINITSLIKDISYNIPSKNVMDEYILYLLETNCKNMEVARIKKDEIMKNILSISSEMKPVQKITPIDCYKIIDRSNKISHQVEKISDKHNIKFIDIVNDLNMKVSFLMEIKNMELNKIYNLFGKINYT